MSATAIFLGAYALVAAPAVFHWRTGRAGSIIASLYIVLGLAILTNLILSSSPMPEVPAIPAEVSADESTKSDSQPKAPDEATSQCAQLLSTLRSSGALLDTSKPPEVVVYGNFWQQISSGHRGAIVTCLAQELPAGSGSPVIVER